MTNEKLLDKISNLMKRAKDKDDAEGEASILLAQKLMAKHNISVSQVQIFESKSEVNESRVEFGRMIWWYAELAATIASHFRCSCMKHGSSVIFVGLGEDAEIATAVYQGAIDHIKYRRRQMTWASKDEKNSYIVGFMCGLDEKLEAQKAAMIKESESTALVLQTPVEVKDYIKNNTTSSYKTSSQVRDLDMDSYFMGLDEGKHAELNRGRILE